jgi:YD repeat-containing protein
VGFHSRHFYARILLIVRQGHSEPPTVVEDDAVNDPELDVPETALSGQGASAEEPTEPAYGIKPPAPLLPDPTDPTLSADLTEQNLVNLFQGAAEYRVPLALPPGVSGHAPNVELRYSSHQARHNGPVGFGWQLELGAIRRVIRGPAVTVHDEDEFYVSLPELQGELVLLATDDITETYGLRREQNFARIERDLASNAWQVALKDGRRYTLGTTAASRLQSDDGGLVSEWHIDVFEDTFGNQVKYSYDRHDGALYPNAIQYGGQSGNPHPFTVAFEPFASGEVGSANRPDRRIDYSAGFPMTRKLLVDQIRILVEGTERLRYDLAYTSDVLDSRSDLTSVTVTGTTADTTTSQELGFSYYQPDTSAAGPRGNLLQKVTLPTGGEIHYDYQPSTQLRDNDGLLNQRPPMPLLVVTALTRSDFTGRQDTTTYQYRNGHFYFDPEVRGQVAGFGRVSQIDPLGQRTEHFFHQGGGFDGTALGETVDDWFLMGRPYRIERYDAAGTLRERQITLWESSLLGEGRSFVSAVDEVTTRFGTGGPDRSSATSKVYDPATGNVLEVIEHSEVVANDDGTFSDTGDDSRRRTTTYAENLQNHILALPATESLYAYDGTLVSRTDYRYDDLPIGQVDRGTRTHEIAHLLEESREIVTRRTYNPAGQLTRIIDPRSHEWTITYDAPGIHPSSVENPLEHVTQYEIDPLTGKTLRETDPNGLVTENSYDGLGRKSLVEQSHPNFSGAPQPVERVTYDDVSRPAAIVTETFLSPTTVSRQAAYLDGFGQTLQTRRQAAGSERYAVSNTVYDPLGRESEQRLAVFGNGIAYDAAHTSPYKTATEFDLFDRVVEVTDANGTTTTGYDAWTETVEDANGHEKVFGHDAFGRLAEVVEHIDGADHTTRYAYDERDQLVAITDAVGNERRFTSDSLGRLIHAEDLHNPNDTTFGAMEYSYDDAGNVVQTVDAAGRQTSTTYDALNRPLVKTFTAPASGTKTVTLTYDEGTHGKGQLTGAQTDETGWEAVYDIRGQIIHEAAVVAGQEYAREYAYNYFGEVALAFYPNDLLVDNRFNEVGELDRVLVNGQDLVSNLEYSPSSLLELIQYGNGAVSQFTHDPARMNRLTAKQTTVPGIELQDLTYDYDPVGNIAQLVESAPTAANRTGNYQYDEVNRLTQADVSAGSGSYQRSYAYDAAGNITDSFLGQYQYAAAHLVNPHAVTRIDYPDGGRSQFSYDETGRLEYFLETGSGHSTMHNHAWDTRAQLVESTAVDRVGSIERQSTTAYTYDHADRRVRKQTVGRSATPQVDRDRIHWIRIAASQRRFSR